MSVKSSRPRSRVMGISKSPNNTNEVAAKGITRGCDDDDDDDTAAAADDGDNDVDDAVVTLDDSNNGDDLTLTTVLEKPLCSIGGEDEDDEEVVAFLHNKVHWEVKLLKERLDEEEGVSDEIDVEVIFEGFKVAEDDDEESFVSESSSFSSK